MKTVLLFASLSLLATPAVAQNISIGGPGGPGNGPPSLESDDTTYLFDVQDDGLGYAFSVVSEGASRLCVEISSSSIDVHARQFGGAGILASHAGGDLVVAGIHEVGDCTVNGIHEGTGCTVNGIHEGTGCTVNGIHEGTGHTVAQLTMDDGGLADLVFGVGPQDTDEDLLAVDLAVPSATVSATLGGPGGAGWGPTEVAFDAGAGSTQIELPSLGLTVSISPVVLVVTGPAGEEVFSVAPPAFAFYAPGTTLGYSSDKDILGVTLGDTWASSITLDGATNSTNISGTTTDLISLTGAHRGFSVVDSSVGELSVSGTLTGYSAHRSSVDSITGSGSISGQGGGNGGNGGNGGPPPTCPTDLDAYGCAPSAQPLFLAYGQFGTPPDDNGDGVVCLENMTTTDNCVE